jgi:uncharacterized membrane protein
MYRYFVSQSSEFATTTFCVASQRMFVVVYFVIDSVRKLLDTLSYFNDSANFDGISGTLNIIGIYSNENCAHKWITELYNF